MTMELLIGLISALSIVIGGIVMRDRQIHRTIASGDEKLHIRVNRMQDTYVRREEFNQRMQSIEGVLNQIRQDQLTLLATFVQSKNN